jgi:hypothetical protein
VKLRMSLSRSLSSVMTGTVGTGSDKSSDGQPRQCQHVERESRDAQVLFSTPRHDEDIADPMGAS